VELVSIQVGMPRYVEWQGDQVLTGIYKDPIPGPVWVRRHQIDGDGQADRKVHGGADKAVYAFSTDAYPWWKQTLGREDLPWGTFGENLTVRGLDEKAFCLGDIFQVGECELEVAEPRFPCSKLGIRLGDMSVLKTFMRSEWPGVYFRVHREGRIRVGDRVRRLSADPQAVSIWDFYEAKRSKGQDAGRVRRVLSVPSLSAEWRQEFEAMAGRARAGGTDDAAGR
jgi:MOSC domain-containing protein YiiM